MKLFWESWDLVVRFDVLDFTFDLFYRFIIYPQFSIQSMFFWFSMLAADVCFPCFLFRKDKIRQERKLLVNIFSLSVFSLVILWLKLQDCFLSGLHAWNIFKTSQKKLFLIWCSTRSCLELNKIDASRDSRMVSKEIKFLECFSGKKNLFKLFSKNATFLPIENFNKMELKMLARKINKKQQVSRKNIPWLTS